jgi:hypothetical protein
MATVKKLSAILLFIDALVHFYAGFLIVSDNAQYVFAGGIVTLIFSGLFLLGFGKNRIFTYLVTMTIGAGILNNLLNFNTIGFPAWIVGLILALDIVIVIGLVRSIVTGQASAATNP